MLINRSYSKKQSVAIEACSRLASEQIPSFYMELKDSLPSMNTTFSWTNTVHIYKTYYFKSLQPMS